MGLGPALLFDVLHLTLTCHIPDPPQADSSLQELWVGSSRVVGGLVFCQ